MTIQRTKPEPTGKDLADIGIASAQAHAEAINPGWSDECMHLLKRFLRNRNRPFAFEAFRAYVVVTRPDLVPPHYNCWGGLARRALRERVVRYTGQFQAAKSKQTHGHLVRLMTKVLTSR